MTKLSYEYTNKAGKTETITSYAELQARLAAEGGSFKSIYETVQDEYVYKGKKERIKL